MRQLVLALLGIIIIYLLVIMGTLERHVEQPRFHVSNPVPVDADTAKCEPGKYGGRVLIGALGDPKTFNPVVSSETSSRDIIARIFSSLVGMNNVTQELVPSLAYKWEFSEDNLELTFHMRRGVLWSDGVPVTAYDAEFPYRAIYDPRVENSLSDIMRVNGEPFKGAAIDSFTFKVSIPSTFAPFLMWAGGSVPILPKHILEPELEKGTFDSAYNISWAPEKLVTCGPYLLEKFESGVKTVLRRNPSYWRIDREGNLLPYLDRIIYVTVRSTETNMLMFQTGDLDMTGISKLSDVPIIERDADTHDYKVANLGSGMGQNMFWFNLSPGKNESGKSYVAPHKLKWFSDVRWRKAMASAVDREGISKTVFGGLAEPQYGPETPANKFWYNPDTMKYGYNLEKSGAYLDSMGLIDRDGDGIRED
ncbi:MAG: hypothetical protein HOC71_11785, partial [Candidatus Latescibacteria bacterium]|nr:hypothetical protein [Candidatus Latescibacterota bacterium]